ncbi:MAG: DUF2442 domain-containing protein [Acidobacteria bacterium]|nr:DUF2442 domain-containing protein [Acidobacteriota bacterium]
MNRITRVTPLPGYQLRLVFDNGIEGVADLSGLVGCGVFAALAQDTAFDNVQIGMSGELVWPNGLDLCADSLYLRITGQSPADVFPSLRREAKIA